MRGGGPLVSYVSRMSTSGFRGVENKQGQLIAVTVTNDSSGASHISVLT